MINYYNKNGPIENIIVFEKKRKKNNKEEKKIKFFN